MKRRFFLRAIAAAPAVLPSIGASQHAKSWGLRNAIGATGLHAPSDMQPTGNSPEWKARDLLAKPFQRLLRKRNEENEFDLAYRSGVFEPDLCALRSISHCARTAYQKQRDRVRSIEPKSLQARIAEIMGWEN